MKPGDLVRITSVPKYWGAKDIRGMMGIVLEDAHRDKFITGPGTWWLVMIDDERWSLPTRCLEVISEAG